MKNFHRIIAAIAIFLLAGCFQVSTVVRVNPDGSGTISETRLLSKKMIARMDELLQGFAGEGGAKQESADLFDPVKLKAQAADMGEGVSYLSGEKTETAEFAGYTAIYAFKDINTLRLNQKSGESASTTAARNAPAMPYLFHFSKGSPATLTIEQPKEKAPVKAAEAPTENAEAPQAAKGAISDEEAKKLADMFMGMKMTLALEVNGSIVETNATHRDGKRITIIDLDLAKFGSSLPQLEKLKRLEGSSTAEAREVLKDFPGMKMDLNDKLKVVFK